MTPELYQALRQSLGDRKRAARMLRCSPVTIRFREEGRNHITEEAAARLQGTVHAAALAADAAWEEKRARRQMRREERTGMTPGQMEAALQALGWDRARFATWLLGGSRADRSKVDRWIEGRAIIPPWVAGHLRRELGLAPGAPWPTGGHE